MVPVEIIAGGHWITLPCSCSGTSIRFQIHDPSRAALHLRRGSTFENKKHNNQHIVKSYSKDTSRKRLTMDAVFINKDHKARDVHVKYHDAVPGFVK
jgi:hypothetical protein